MCLQEEDRAWWMTSSIQVPYKKVSSQVTIGSLDAGSLGKFVEGIPHITPSPSPPPIITSISSTTARCSRWALCSDSWDYLGDPLVGIVSL